MTLDVEVLGCSGSYAAPGGACTGFLVTSGGADETPTNVWLDAGPGTLGRLQQRLPLATVDAIVISHEHPDHWLELPVVYTAVRYYLGGAPIPVYGTAGTLDLARRLLAELEIAFTWHTVTADDVVDIGGQRWRFARTDHYVETLACRIDADDKSAVFTSDTGPGWHPASMGEGVDLLVSESTFLSDREHEGIAHLSARQAGSLAAEVGPGRLVLTHLAPGQEPGAHSAEAELAFGRPVQVARAGDRIHTSG
ncbi:MAG: MBL fold metallo-hydrolase [Acidimicrobiales bacterium]|nr:MBL fold metallo-hydrolase [Acidimicrobiales bacterium]